MSEIHIGFPSPRLGGKKKHYLIYHSGDITEKSTPLDSLWTSVPNAIQIPSLQRYPLRMKQGNTCFHWAISQPSMSNTDIKSAELAPSRRRRVSLQQPGVYSITWDGLETSQLKCAVGNPHTTSLLMRRFCPWAAMDMFSLGLRDNSAWLQRPLWWSWTHPSSFFVWLSSGCVNWGTGLTISAIWGFPSDQTQWSLPVPRSVTLGKPGARHVVS